MANNGRSITVVENESGQALLELMLGLPLLFGFITLAIKINSIITSSIVNQRWARFKVFQLAHNGATYPLLKYQEQDIMFGPTGYNRFVLGISDKPIVSTNNQPVAYAPSIYQHPIENTPTDEANGIPAKRNQIKIRTTVSICTQPTQINKERVGPNTMSEAQAAGGFDMCAGGTPGEVP